jgi:hypothetical protein
MINESALNQVKYAQRSAAHAIKAIESEQLSATDRTQKAGSLIDDALGLLMAAEDLLSGKSS